MSILETPKQRKPQEESHKVRLELKEWERSFAAAHGGRKASRDDIKQHPDIAYKYKLYNKLRSAASHVAPSPKSIKRTSSPAPTDHIRVPSPKRHKTSQPIHPGLIDPYDSPRSVRRTPVHHRTCIGPTPQKDGRVLGLFDLLSPASGGLKTPSKRYSLGAVDVNAFSTPSKQRPAAGDKTVCYKSDICRKGSRSPISASKRNYLESFLTPSTRRVADISTPGSKARQMRTQSDDTPTFLRRDSQKAWIERQAKEGEDNEEASWSPVAVRRRPKLIGRGLSALVEGLRDMEDEKLDEEMEILREFEAGEGSTDKSTTVRKPPTVAVEDSQVFDMPLGPDGAEASDDDDDNDNKLIESRGRGGKPLRVWKKKGQKRTTRKANIRPNNTKWKPEPEWKAADGDAVDETTLIAETQVAGPIAKSPRDPEESDGLEYLDEDPSNRVEDSKTADAKPKARGRPSKPQCDAAIAKKKVSATAHANFRALKIKNKHSKGKKGARFGRGRR